MTLGQVRTVANARLAALWTNIILPKQLAWFAIHGRYAQALHTQNIPNTSAADIVVQELIPITDVAPHDHPGQTAREVFGNVNINVSLPFALAAHAYNGPQGHGFVGQVWVKFDGTIYTRAKNYGPEEWRTFDWNIATGDIVASIAATYLPTFTAAGRWVAALPRRAAAAWRGRA